MSLFRKKPVVIEAWQITRKGAEDRGLWPDWMKSHPSTATQMDWSQAGERVDHDAGIPYISIDTLEGRMRADIGDWVIKGVKGELYPCKPDIFTATYDPVAQNDGSGGDGGVSER